MLIAGMKDRERRPSPPVGGACLRRSKCATHVAQGTVFQPFYFTLTTRQKSRKITSSEVQIFACVPESGYLSH